MLCQPRKCFRVWMLAALVMVLFLAGCDAPAAEPTERWIATLPATVVSGLSGPMSTVVANIKTTTPQETLLAATSTPEAVIEPTPVEIPGGDDEAWMLTSDTLAQSELLLQLGADGLPFHRTGTISSAAWSPNGGRIAVVGSEGAAVVDGYTLGLVTAFNTGMPGEAVAMSLAGLVAVGGQGVVQVWDTSSGAMLYSLEANGKAVQFSQDGSLLSNGELVWTASDGALVSALEAPKQSPDALGPQQGIVFSASGNRVGVAFANGDMYVWDTATGSRMSETPVRNAQRGCRASTWNSWMVSLCDVPYENVDQVFSEVWYLDMEDEIPVGRMFRNYDPHGELALIPETGRIAWLSGDAAAGTLVMEEWDLASASLVGSGPAPAVSAPLEHFVINPPPEDRKLVTWTESTLQVWQSSDLVLQSYNRVAGVSSLAFEPREGGYVLGLGRADGGIELWSTQERVQDWPAHQGPVNGMAFSSDARQLVSAGADGLVLVWDLTVGELATGFDLNGYGALNGVAFSPDGLGLAVAADDALLLDVGSGEIRVTLDAHSQVMAVAFSPDGSILATFGADGVVEVWQVVDGAQVSGQEMGVAPLTRAAFSPNLCALTYGVEPAGTVEWLNLVANQAVQIPASSGPLGAVTISLDGRLLAVGGEDGSVSVWGLAGALDAPAGAPVNMFCGAAAMP